MSPHKAEERGRRKQITEQPSANPVQEDKFSPQGGPMCNSPPDSFTAYAEQTAPKPTNRLPYRQQLVARASLSPRDTTISSSRTTALSPSQSPILTSPAFFVDRSTTSQNNEPNPTYSRARPPSRTRQIDRPPHPFLLTPSTSSVQPPSDIEQAAQAAIQRMFGRRLEHNQAMRVSFHGPSDSQILEEELEATFERLSELESARHTVMNGVPELGYFGPEGVLRPLPPLPNPPRQQQPGAGAHVVGRDRRTEQAEALLEDSRLGQSPVGTGNPRWNIQRMDMEDPEVMWWLGRWMQVVAIAGVSGGVGVVVWGVLQH